MKVYVVSYIDTREAEQPEDSYAVVGVYREREDALNHAKRLAEEEAESDNVEAEFSDDYSIGTYTVDNGNGVYVVTVDQLNVK